MNFLILPSLQETAPMVIAEAFASGKPVIASNVCGIPYMVDDGRNGLLIDPRNEKEIADAIQYLLENPDVSKSMSCKGKIYAKENHSLNMIINKYNKIYNYISDINK